MTAPPPPRQKPRRLQWPSIPLVLLTIVSLALAAYAWFWRGGGAGSGGREVVATFVQATDPHLFLERKYDSLQVERDSVRRLWQERMDREALRGMLAAAGSLPREERPQFILVTGDLGIDTTTRRDSRPTAPTADSLRWREQADTVAAILSESPIPRVLWVPGNNDVGGERGDMGSLAMADEFNALVAQRLRNGVTLQNLTACFTGPGSCVADVGATRHTVVGVPTVSFKNSAPDTAGNGAAQAAILARTDTLVRAEAGRGRRLLLATHIPDLDDPFARGAQLYAGAVPAREPVGASAWNVSDSAFAQWKRVVEHASVDAVLAGHFHDSHREVYRPPYGWSASSPLRAGASKLFLAPPLSVKNQDASPVQARGFALVRLFEDGVDRRMYWFDPATSRFEPEPEGDDTGGRDAGDGWMEGLQDLLVPDYFWGIGQGLAEPGRTAVFLMGILLAFLTIAALWELPDSSKKSEATNTAGGASGGGASAPAANSAESLAVFQSNLGRTVLSGLGGIAAVALLQDVMATSGPAKPFFLAVFIFYFLVFLLGIAVLRGIIEVLRSAVALDHRLVRGTVAGPGAFWRAIWNALVRIGRHSTLVFLDTMASVMFGRGLRQVQIWENRNSAMQRSLIRIVDAVREDVSNAVGKAIRHHGFVDAHSGTDYRVAVSLLDSAHAETYYISSDRGVLDRAFSPKSMAFVAAVVGQDRWWKQIYTDARSVFRSMPLMARTTGLHDTTGFGEVRVLQRGGRIATPASSSVALRSVDGGNIAQPLASADTVEELKDRVQTWLDSRGVEADVSLEDGYLVLAARPGTALTPPASLTWGDVELGPFAADPQKTVLYTNDQGLLAGHPGVLDLAEYFATRAKTDYRAFMLISVPPRRGGAAEEERRAVIHLSFRYMAYIDALWPGLDEAENGVWVPRFDAYDPLDNPNADLELLAALRSAAKVIGEAIQELTDVWIRERSRCP